MKKIKKITRQFFSLFGLSVIKEHTYIKLLKYQSIYNFIDNGGNQSALNFIDRFDTSYSQLHQDLFVLYELNFKKNGYFVEFGATDGKKLSNTYLLEKEYGWSGILAEPAKCWHNSLRVNRNCNISTKCVWKDSSSLLDFDEDEIMEFSTITKYKDSDHLLRAKTNSYKVETITLLDLLKKYNAPKEIDYISIDTEGSEWEIIKSFDFDEYNIKIITCEHNNTPNREKIYNYLKSYGYKRKYESLSRWDDWYIKVEN